MLKVPFGIWVYAVDPISHKSDDNVAGGQSDASGSGTVHVAKIVHDAEERSREVLLALIVHGQRNEQLDARGVEGEVDHRCQITMEEGPVRQPTFYV